MTDGDYSLSEAGRLQSFMQGIKRKRPYVIVDLFCKAGGAARGLEQAGYYVVGVDIEPQPNYPYPFLRMDAIKFLKLIETNGFRFIWTLDSGRTMETGIHLSDIAGFWASPPCLDTTNLKHAPNAKEHKCFIKPTQRELRRLEKKYMIPYIIENVDSPVARERLKDPVLLCGRQFDLGVSITHLEPIQTVHYHLDRHRLFECSFPVYVPEHNNHTVHVRGEPVIGIYGGHARCRSKKHGGRGTKDFVGYSQADLAADALGLDRGCMTLDEYGNAIPPAYAEFLARQMMDFTPKVIPCISLG